MRDFPVFTTENGVGSLVLREIPYSGIAYVTVQDSSFPTVFIKECLEFCRVVGAAQVYATGHEVLEDYPDQSEKIEKFLRSRLDADSDQKEIKKAIDALIRRGHSYGAIRSVLNDLSFDSDDYIEDF